MGHALAGPDTFVQGPSCFVLFRVQHFARIGDLCSLRARHCALGSRCAAQASAVLRAGMQRAEVSYAR